jgi:hypothetical protein
MLINLCNLDASPMQDDFKAELHRAPHTPSFTEYLSRFGPQDVQVTTFPRKNGDRGVKPFGHGVGSFTQKVLKYSVNTPPMGDP